MSQNKNTLGLIFSLCFGLVVAAAFVQALTYDFVSARAPLVILIPLLILSVFQIKRDWTAARGTDIKGDLSNTLHLNNSSFNSIAGFMGWMIALLAMIFVTGHYAGIAAFIFLLLYIVAEERFTLSASVAIIVTLVLLILFEFIFNIPLYRGLIYRIWAGYDIF